MSKKALVVGYGVSGKAAENFLETRGYAVTVLEEDSREIGGGGFDVCVVSPGVPKDSPILREAAERVIPIIPELELPFYLDETIKPEKTVAVTGTNGKTTVVNQIHAMCVRADRQSVLCGNVGTPVSAVAEKLTGSVAVIEVSSFMLEQSKLLSPDIAVILNIAEDHLDRHRTMEEYTRCKSQIFARQKKGGHLVLNWDDKICRRLGREAKKSKRLKVVWYSTEARVNGYHIDGGWVYRGGRLARKKLFALSDIGGALPHAVSNALASLAVGRLLGIKLPAIVESIKYKEQKHRIEKVAEKGGVAYYNDSKATNIASVLAAVKCFSLPVNLILCGQTKGQDYSELFRRLPASVKNIIVFGDCQMEVLTNAALFEFENIFPVANLEEAVDLVAEKAAAGVSAASVVLFSPGGSSFDQFKNYEERGNKFCDLVRSRML